MNSMSSTRRTFLATASLLPLLPAAAFAAPQSVTIENFSASGKDLGSASVPKVAKSDADKPAAAPAVNQKPAKKHARKASHPKRSASAASTPAPAKRAQIN